MQIAIIGYGNMGSGIAKRAAVVGYSVVLAGRDLVAAKKAAASVGALAATPAEAVAGAELIVLATPYAVAANALGAAGDLNNRVLIDISNPLKPDFSGLTIGQTTSAGEEIAKLARGARVVKAFNTVFAPIFSEGPDLKGGTVPVFYAGDDAAAKESVRQFAERLGFATIDAGGLVNARMLEPLGMLNITLGYKLGGGTSIAPPGCGAREQERTK
jgi:predicted dinucleotide-binding enzyme